MTDWLAGNQHQLQKWLHTHNSLCLRLSTSAPAGDPDPYPRVYRLTESIPRFGQVIRHRWPRLAGQVLAEKTGTCHGSGLNGYLQVLTSTQRYSWVSLKNDSTETWYTKTWLPRSIIIFRSLALLFEDRDDLVTRDCSRQVAPSSQHWSCMCTLIR